MKKQCWAGMAVMAWVALGLNSQAQASLVVAGTVDSGPYAGVQVINDTDLNITWLDYSNTSAASYSQMSWASSLSLTVNGVTYDNWRLPSTVDDSQVYSQQLPANYSYSGEYSSGYNNTTSEMGHLYYTELGNNGRYDTNGNYQPGYGLTETGPFANLVSSWYWSGTEYLAYPNVAWGFYTNDGRQDAAITSRTAWSSMAPSSPMPWPFFPDRFRPCPSPPRCCLLARAWPVWRAWAEGGAAVDALAL